MRRKPLRLALTALAAVATAVATLTSSVSVAGAALAAAGTSALHLDYDHLVLSSTGDRLAVKEAIGMTNTGTAPLDRIGLPLPPGYQDLKLESGFTAGKATAQADGLLDTAGLGLGLQREIVFSYYLPLSADGTATITKRVDYVTGALSVTAEARSIRLSGGRGLAALTSDLNGVTYNSLKADDVPAGTSYDIQVTVGSFSTAAAPPPGAGATAGGSAGRLLNRSIHGGPDNVMLWQRLTGQPGHWGLPGIAIILGIIVVGGGAVARAIVNLRRQRSPAPRQPAAAQVMTGPVTTGPATVGPATAGRAELVRAIADLDRQFKQGRVSEADYRLRRSALKRQLMDVVSRTEG